MQNIDNISSGNRPSSKDTARKGQAALEFMVTYGWAILAAMVVIGALAYFGIFNTQRYVNDVCYFGDQLQCEDYAAYRNGIAQYRLRNNFGVPIDVTTATAKSDYGSVVCGSITPNSNIPSGTLFEVRCQLTGGTLPTNNKIKFKSTVTFRRNGSSNLHNQTGDVTINVQP